MGEPLSGHPLGRVGAGGLILVHVYATYKHVSVRTINIILLCNHSIIKCSSLPV